MKRHLALILSLIMMLSLAACGNQTNTEESSTTNEQTESTTLDSQETENTEESTESVETETPTESEEETPAFSARSLSVWGLPEPSFEYELVGYCETMQGPDIRPMLIYQASGDFDTASAYAASVSNAGFLNPNNGAYIPNPDGETCTYSGVLGDYKVSVIKRPGSSDIFIKVIDNSKTASWDDALDVYVFPEYGEYGSYGEYNLDLLDT